MKKTWIVCWQQTEHERFDTDVNARAEAAVLALGFTSDGSAGGTAFDDLSGLPCDNTVYVIGTVEQTLGIHDALTPILGHPETIRILDQEEVMKDLS